VKARTLALSAFPLAVAFWFISFYWQPINFWLDMSLATLTLLALSLYFGGYTIPHMLSLKVVLVGVLSAVGLYFVFFLGRYATLMLPAGRLELNEIYSLKLASQPFIESILLVFPIAVGEEVYWRGLLEKQLSDWLGNTKGTLLAAALYGAVHLWSQSLTLVLAASVAGLWWCVIFNRTRNIFTVIISHSLWSLLVFIILPLS
jgi:membrane protease YdiL (CAAX protease family)